MANAVSLREVIDEMQMQSDETHAYLDKSTSEIVSFTDEMISAAEDDSNPEDLPEWEREGITGAKKMLESEEDFVELPGKWDINEWSIMERFCGTIADGDLRDELDYLIHGNGAFRLFKDAINRHRIADDWYKFRDEALEEIAVDWLEANHIPFVRDVSENG